MADLGKPISRPEAIVAFVDVGLVSTLSPTKVGKG